MRVLYSSGFRKEFSLLPIEIQELCKRQESIFRIDWRDSRLHAKKLKEHPIGHSFRITRRYRVLFIFVEEDVALFSSIGHRKDVYD